MPTSSVKIFLGQYVVNNRRNFVPVIGLPTDPDPISFLTGR